MITVPPSGAFGFLPLSASTKLVSKSGYQFVDSVTQTVLEYAGRRIFQDVPEEQLVLLVVSASQVFTYTSAT